MTPAPTPAGPDEPINSPPPPAPSLTPPADSPADAPRFPSQPKAQGASTEAGRVVTPSAEPSAVADPFRAEPTAAGPLPTPASPEASVGNRLQSKRQRPGLIGPQ